MEHRKQIGIAETGSGVAGFYQFESRSESRVAWLNYIGVRAAFRGLGVGKRLLEAFETHACQDGFESFELDVLVENETAIRFYERQGYSRMFAHEHRGRWKLRYAKTSVRDPQSSAPAKPTEAVSFMEQKYWRFVYLVLVELPRGFR